MSNGYRVGDAAKVLEMDGGSRSLIFTCSGLIKFPVHQQSNTEQVKLPLPDTEEVEHWKYLGRWEEQALSP